MRGLGDPGRGSSRAGWGFGCFGPRSGGSVMAGNTEYSFAAQLKVIERLLGMGIDLPFSAEEYGALTEIRCTLNTLALSNPDASIQNLEGDFTYIPLRARNFTYVPLRVR